MAIVRYSGPQRPGLIVFSCIIFAETTASATDFDATTALLCNDSQEDLLCTLNRDGILSDSEDTEHRVVLLQAAPRHARRHTDTYGSSPRVSRHASPCGAASGDCLKSITWAIGTGIAAHPAWYPGLSTSSTSDEVQAYFARTNQHSCPKPCTGCLPPSDECVKSVNWARQVGILSHPDWYVGLSVTASAEEVQAYFAKRGDHGCTAPCSTCQEASGDCLASIRWAKKSGISTHPEWYPGLNITSSQDDVQRHFAIRGEHDCKLPCPHESDYAVAKAIVDFPPGECSDKDSCLRIVDAYLQRVNKATWFAGDAHLLNAYGANHQGGGTCRNKYCKMSAQCPGFGAWGYCRSDTYDNAVAAIYFTKRGDFPRAKQILDAFIQLLYPGKEVKFGGKKVSYGGADGVPSGRWVTLLASAYRPTKAEPGQYSQDVLADVTIQLGNNVWAALAFAHYAADASEPCYALVARDILHAVLAANITCEDDMKGFMARLPPDDQIFTRSTEHNIDMYALARMLGESDTLERARSFVQHMFGYSWDGSQAHSYSTGTGGLRRCDTRKVDVAGPVDTQLWNLLADVDDNFTRTQASLTYTLRQSADGGMISSDIDEIGNHAGEGKGEKMIGFRFSSRGTGIQWENTASGIMSLVHFREMHGEIIGESNVTLIIQRMRRSMAKLASRYGTVLASVRGGNWNAYIELPRNSTYPGGTDTGLGWTYLRYPHTAATAWFGLLMLQQSSDQEQVDKHANPYFPPKQPVPDASASMASKTQCLP